MERMRYRSTSLVDLMAELRERDLKDEARRLANERRTPARSRAGRFGLRIFGFRPRKG